VCSLAGAPHEEVAVSACDTHVADTYLGASQSPMCGPLPTPPPHPRPETGIWRDSYQ
jgi:hypothetical protein